MKSRNELAAFRNAHIGFVFQFHYLLSESKALQNVKIPALKLARYTPAEIEKRAYQKLKMLRMHDFALKSSLNFQAGNNSAKPSPMA